MLPLKSLKYSDKLALLRGARYRGLGPLARQVWLIGVDVLYKRRHLVFRQEARALAKRNLSIPDGFTMREIRAWNELSSASRARLARPDAASKWGSKEWFERGWRLWVGEQESQIAALAWWRGVAESPDFFVPLASGEEVLWHVFVLPEYRGQNLHCIMWTMLARHRVADGITHLLTNCRQFNIPSRRNIETSGFERIGHCDENRFIRRRTWRKAEKGKSD